MSATKLEDLLRKRAAGNLEKIIQTAQKVDSLTATMRAALPADLADNLLAANVHDNGELVIVCSTSAWASRVRFESDTLIRAARDAGLRPERCRVRVAR